MVVTVAVRLPAAVGLTSKSTVIDVGLAETTVPVAPLLNATVLFKAVASKPKPLIVTEGALAATLTVRLVTTGVTVRTCAVVPATPLVVTVAFNTPAVVGLVVKATVSLVAVAKVTVPTALLLKATELLAAIVSKPKPSMVSVDASAAKLVVATVATGLTVATFTAPALLTPFVRTMANKSPATFGDVVRLTVSVVAVALVTVPTALPSKSRTLSVLVVLNPKPLMVMVVALAAMTVELAETTGIILAT